MKPISLKNFDKEEKTLTNHGGVCFVFKFNKDKVPTDIDKNNVEKYYYNLLLISESRTDCFGRIKKHIKSFLGITVGVKTGKKLAECAEKNGHSIDNLYAVYIETLRKETEITRFEENMKRLPCGNDRRI